MGLPAAAPAQLLVAVVIRDMLSRDAEDGVVDPHDRELARFLGIYLVRTGLARAVLACGVVPRLTLGLDTHGGLAVVGDCRGAVALLAAPFEQAPLDDAQHARQVVAGNHQHIDDHALH
ncbi:hypothetical protein D3C78_1441220 [compost metagenome]